MPVYRDIVEMNKLAEGLSWHVLHLDLNNTSSWHRAVLRVTLATVFFLVFVLNSPCTLRAVPAAVMYSALTQELKVQSRRASRGQVQIGAEDEGMESWTNQGCSL